METNRETFILESSFLILRIVLYPLLVTSNMVAALFLALPALYFALPFFGLNVIWFCVWVVVSLLAPLARNRAFRPYFFILALPFLLLGMASIILMPTYIPNITSIFSTTLPIKSIERLDYLLSFPFCGESTPLMDQTVKSRAAVLNRAIAALLAKIAKADGKVSRSEVETARKFLQKLTNDEVEYQKCAKAFNKAKDDKRDIAYYAQIIVKMIGSEDACLLIYEVVWSVAAADAKLDPAEDRMLKLLAPLLGLTLESYTYFKRLFFAKRQTSSCANSTLEIEKAYAILGCNPSDSDEELKSAYRKHAMKYHPDRLQAKGMSDELVRQATQTMADINRAWEIVKSKRGIS